MEYGSSSLYWSEEQGNLFIQSFSPLLTSWRSQAGAWQSRIVSPPYLWPCFCHGWSQRLSCNLTCFMVQRRDGRHQNPQTIYKVLIRNRTQEMQFHQMYFIVRNLISLYRTTFHRKRTLLHFESLCRKFTIAQNTLWIMFRNRDSTKRNQYLLCISLHTWTTWG